MEKSKILIVDDMPQNIQLAAGILKSPDLEIIFTKNSLSVIEMAEKEDPDLILLDVMMPDLDGYEVCRRLKQSELTKEIPVIFLTAKNDSEGVLEGFQAGSADYILKPFNARELIARVQTHLSLRKAKKKMEIYSKSIEEANEKLKVSNENLENFASLISHDLNEPLTSLMGFLDLFKNEYEKVLDSDGKVFLQEMRKSSKRMSLMIHDLLDYSKLSSMEQTKTMQSLNNLLSMALANLKSLIERENAVITFDPLPELPVNPTQIVRLFQNLIINGIKYHGSELPKVHISALKESQQWILSVRDNGIGIEEKFYSQIFKIFKRLHDDETYQGTGIGLAACQKIVENHRGKIWLESTLEKGTTFYFSIPWIEGD